MQIPVQAFPARCKQHANLAAGLINRFDCAGRDGDGGMDGAAAVGAVAGMERSERRQINKYILRAFSDPALAALKIQAWL